MNNKYKNMPIILFGVLILGSGGFYTYQKVFLQSSSRDIVNEIRNENKPGLDSLQSAIDNENRFSMRIEIAIREKDFETAYKLIDSLPPFGKSHSKLLYRGMIFEKQEKYEQAIEEYSKAIEELPYSKGKSLRANVYRKLNMLPSALADYKEIYQYNHYYSFHVGEIFKQMNQKDSALKYYKIFSGHYPSDTLVMHRIMTLSK